ncbi:acetyl-CoA synthetase-like protein [Apiospora sp. TS-2023a]
MSCGKHISFDREDVSLVVTAGDDIISAQFRRTETSRNMLAVLFCWLCLAGSIVFPEAFGPLHRLVTGRAVRFAIRNIPYYYAATFSGLLGSLGLVWLWWTVKYNHTSFAAAGHTPPVADALPAPERGSHMKSSDLMPNTPSTGLTRTIVIFERFADAIKRCSHKVINKFGEPAGGFPTICYVGPNDACYFVFMVATKTGYKVSAHAIMSQGHADLGRLSSCPLETRKQDSSVCLRQNVAISSLHYPMPAKFSHALVVLHTSGSTYFLKPITVRQGMLAIAETTHGIPDWQGMQFFIREWASVTSRTLNPSEHQSHSRP